MKRLFALNPEKKVAGFDETWRCRPAKRRATSTPSRRGCPTTTSATAIASVTTPSRGRSYDHVRPAAAGRSGDAGDGRAHRAVEPGARALRAAASAVQRRAVGAQDRSAPLRHPADGAHVRRRLRRELHAARRARRAPARRRAPGAHPCRRRRAPSSRTSPTRSTPCRSASTSSSSTPRSSRSKRSCARSAACLRAAAELRLHRHRHHLQPSRPRRVAVRQASARPRRSGRHARRSAAPADDVRRLDGIRPACAPGFGRTHRREADRSSRATKGPRSTRAIRALAQRRWSRAGSTSATTTIPTPRSSPASTRAFFELEVAGARRAARRRSAPGGRAFAACATLDTPPPARSPSSWSGSASTRSTPAKAARTSSCRSRPTRAAATGGSRSAMSVALLVVILLARAASAVAAVAR